MKILYRSLSLLALSIALSCNAMESPTQQDFIVIAGQQIPLDTTVLDLSFKNLPELPDSIGRLTNLEKLNLSGNQLRSLPDSIGNLTNLKELDLLHNRLDSLPDSMGNLVNLQFLQLTANRLNSLPTSIGNLVNLKKLHLSYNKLHRLPESIGNLANLEALGLGGSPLGSLPDSIGNLTKLQILHLSGSGLSSLPDSIGNLADLKFLFLPYNRLNNLPDSIGNLTKLEYLNLEYNPIKAIPPSIASWLEKIPTLQGLDKKKQIPLLVTNYNRSILNQFMRYFSAFIHGPLADRVQNERKLHILIKQMCQAQVDLKTPVNDKGDTILHILAATEDPAINYLDEPQVDLTKDRVLGLMLLLATECKADLAKLKNEGGFSVIEVLINRGSVGLQRLEFLMKEGYKK